MFSSLGMILKPIMALNGVKDFQVRFDADRQVVVITGTKSGQGFITEQTFQEIEQGINGETTARPVDMPAGG